MVFGWGESHEAYQNAYDDGQPNEAKFSHEAIAGAASFAAFKSFEDSRRNEGQPVSHQFAKEALVGLVGAEVDRLAETKGMDFYDKERAKHQAKENVQNLYDDHYVQGQGADQYDPNQYGAPQQIQQYGNW